MGGREARRLCPHALVVPPRWSAYVEASRAVFAIFRETAPVVEGISIDEAFLDVAGLERITGTPHEIAQRLRWEVREQVGLPITVGVATTKHLAKVASAAAKPDGLLVVPIGGELAFLHPLPVERLWGVGPATARRLHACGIATVGDAAALDEAALITLLGRAAGRMVHALAHNRDPRRVQRRRARRAFGAQSALGRRRRSPAEVDSVLVGLVDRVTRRMRAAGRGGRTGGGGRRGGGARRPRPPPHARGGEGGADGDAASALRRLLARDPLAHDAARDGREPAVAAHGARAAARGAVRDRAARADAGGHLDRRHRVRRRRRAAHAPARRGRWPRARRGARRGARALRPEGPHAGRAARARPRPGGLPRARRRRRARIGGWSCPTPSAGAVSTSAPRCPAARSCSRRAAAVSRPAGSPRSTSAASRMTTAPTSTRTASGS